MPFVAGGLGLPEEGAVVVAGLGVSEVDANAMSATLAGAGTLVGTLTDGAAVTGGAPFASPWVIPYLPQPEKPRVGVLAAHLHGASSMTAAIDFAIDADQLAYELSVALLLDLV